MQVYLLLDERKNLYATSTDKEKLLKKEKDTVKVSKIDLREVDEIKPPRENYYSICMINYCNREYWFTANNYGAAVVELYFTLGKPNDFFEKIEKIYDYSLFENSLEDYSVDSKQGYEKPDVFPLGALVKNILGHVNEFNRDFCALAIRELSSYHCYKFKTEKELQLYQAKQFPGVNVSDFSTTSLEDLKHIEFRSMGYFSMEQYDCSYDFGNFHLIITREHNKKRFLFWAFVYDCCLGQTFLPFFLYKAIVENQFFDLYEEFIAKRKYFKDWDQPWG